MVKILSTSNAEGLVNASDENGNIVAVESIKIVRENGKVLYYGPDTRLYRLALAQGTKHQCIEGSLPGTVIVL